MDTLQTCVKVEVALWPKDLRGVAARLIKLANQIEAKGEDEEAEEEEPTPTKKAGKKAAKVVEEDEEDSSDDSDDDSDEDGNDDSDSDSEDSEESDEEEEPKKVAKPTLKTMMKAFQAYVKRHGATGKKKAKAVLQKFKVSSLDDLDPKHYKKVMEMIG